MLATVGCATLAPIVLGDRYPGETMASPVDVDVKSSALLLLDYQAGYFDGISEITAKLSGLIHDVNPVYEFPRSLARTILLEATREPYLMLHVPSLATQGQPHPQGRQGQLRAFLESLVFGAPGAKRA